MWGCRNRANDIFQKRHKFIVQKMKIAECPRRCKYEIVEPHGQTSVNSIQFC